MLTGKNCVEIFVGYCRGKLINFSHTATKLSLVGNVNFTTGEGKTVTYGAIFRHCFFTRTRICKFYKKNVNFINHFDAKKSLCTLQHYRDTVLQSYNYFYDILTNEKTFFFQSWFSLKDVF